jgi:hypothetical protein
LGYAEENYQMQARIVVIVLDLAAGNQANGFDVVFQAMNRG